MRMLMAAAMAIALAAPAAAQQTYNSGQVNQNASQANSQGGFNGTGATSASTGSGFNSTFSAQGDQAAVFSSAGAASAHVEATPFSVSVNSAHAGNFVALGLNGGSVTGVDQNFGQAAGNTSFTANGGFNANTSNSHTDFNLVPGGSNVDVPVFENPNTEPTIPGFEEVPM